MPPNPKSKPSLDRIAFHLWTAANAYRGLCHALADPRGSGRFAFYGAREATAFFPDTDLVSSKPEYIIPPPLAGFKPLKIEAAPLYPIIITPEPMPGRVDLLALLDKRETFPHRYGDTAPEGAWRLVDILAASMPQWLWTLRELVQFFHGAIEPQLREGGCPHPPILPLGDKPPARRTDTGAFDAAIGWSAFARAIDATRRKTLRTGLAATPGWGPGPGRPPKDLEPDIASLYKKWKDRPKRQAVADFVREHEEELRAIAERDGYKQNDWPAYLRTLVDRARKKYQPQLNPSSDDSG